MISDSSSPPSHKHQLSNTIGSARATKQRRLNQGQNGRPSNPFNSIESFFSQIHFLVVVQDDNDLLLQTIERNFAQNVKENVNGIALSREAFTDLIQQIRIDVFSRRLVSESFLVIPDEKVAGSAVIGYTSKISGIKNGKEVVATVFVWRKSIYNAGRGRYPCRIVCLKLKTTTRSLKSQKITRRIRVKGAFVLPTVSLRTSLIRYFKEEQ